MAPHKVLSKTDVMKVLLLFIPLVIGLCALITPIAAEKRAKCSIVYVYVRDYQIYERHRETCQGLTGQLAMPKVKSEATDASLLPFTGGILRGETSRQATRRDKYFIGAKKTEDGIYRWEDGRKVEDPYDKTISNIGEVLDQGRLGRCLALVRKNKGSWESLLCHERSFAICQICLDASVYEPEEGVISHCVCPRGERKEPSVGALGSDQSCETKGCYIGRSAAVVEKRLEKPCRPDRWGPDCQWQCYCNGGKGCDLENGRCPSAVGNEKACQEPWLGEACNITHCEVHKWGKNATGHPICKTSCFCKNRQQCDPGTGECYVGCMDGVIGESCDDATCPPQKFGDRCEKHCHCKTTDKDGNPLPGKGKCSRIDGFCFADECEDRWHGRSCNETVCDVGKWGDSCHRFCACQGGQQCNRLTGACPCACRCKNGWDSSSGCTDCCDKSKKCPFQKWGANCVKSCDCSDLGGNIEPCDDKTGACATDTAKGFVRSPTHCEEPGRHGKLCKKRCHVKNCLRCHRWRGDGHVCLYCDSRAGFELEGRGRSEFWNTSRTCIRSCGKDKNQEIRVWGEHCQNECEDKNCAHCSKQTGKCIRCQDFWVFNQPAKSDKICQNIRRCPNPLRWGDSCQFVNLDCPGQGLVLDKVTGKCENCQECTPECYDIAAWGSKCDKKCEDPKCFHCGKYDGVCDDCIVGWKIGSPGKCVEDPEFDEYIDQEFDKKENIMLYLCLVLICETMFFATLFYGCGCHQQRNKWDDEDDESDDEDGTQNQDWTQTAKYKREDFVAAAKAAVIAENTHAACDEWPWEKDWSRMNREPITTFQATPEDSVTQENATLGVWMEL